MLIRESLAASLPAMRRSEADVARRLLRDPGRVASHSLREVAAWCGTSDATVVRACRAAGYDGFQDLKYHVLRELTGPGKAPAAERTGDAQPDYTADIAAGLAASTAALPQALRLLKSATRVAFAGVGASLGIGMILTDVLSAMGRQALPLADEQALHFILTPPVKGLVLMAISHSGESRFALKAATEARRAGVPVIGVSNEPASELARSVDVYLPTQTVERAEGSFSIAPRVCQLAVLDRLVGMLRLPADRTAFSHTKAPRLKRGR